MTDSIRLKNSHKDIFYYLKENEKILYNKEEINELTREIVNRLDMKSFNAESLFNLINMIKILILKDKNIHLDSIFSLSYVLLFLFNKNNISNKILFQYAGIYNDLNEKDKSCYAIMKQFEIDKISIRKFNSKEEKSEWIQFEYNKILDNLSNIRKEFYQMVNYTLQNLELKNIVINDFKLNFFILFINNSVNEMNIEFIEKIYEYLKISENIFILKNQLSQVHFNNLIKVICRINEILIKKENENNLKLSNKIKFLFYDLLFYSKHANVDTTLLFLMKDVTDFLILQKNRNWKNLIQNNKNFLNENLINQFFDFVVNKLEEIVKNDSDKILKYLNIVGKIYNFYNNINLQNKTLEYSDKILSCYLKNGIVVNETLLIKVNLFRDYLNENKNKLEISQICKNIIKDLEELTLLVKSLKLLQDSDEDVFIIIFSFLRKCLENLIILLNNNLLNKNLSEISERIDDLFEYTLKSYKQILSKKNELIEMTKFFYFNKIFITDHLNKNYSQILSKFLGDKIYQIVDLKIKINLIVTYLTRVSEIDKIIYLILISMKLHYEIHSHAVISFIKILSKESKNLITENNLYFYIEKLLEILFHFEKESDNKFNNSNNQFDKEEFFSKLEKLLLIIFNNLIQKINCHLKNKNVEEFTNILSKFFNYYKRISDLNENFKHIFNYENYNVNSVILLEMFENILIIHEDASMSVCFITKSLLNDSSLLKELLHKNLTEISHFIKSICYDYVMLRKEYFISDSENKSDNTFIKLKKFYFDLICKSSAKKKLKLNEPINEPKKHLNLFNVVNKLCGIYEEFYESNFNLEIKKIINLFDISNDEQIIRRSSVNGKGNFNKYNVMINKENVSIMKTIGNLIGLKYYNNNFISEIDFLNLKNNIIEKLQKKILNESDYYNVK